MQPMHCMKIDPDNGRLLLRLALHSIEYGLAHGRVMAIDIDQYPPALRLPGACFLTLTEGGSLRGCTGALEPTKALAEQVVEAAYAAAFRDPRFAALREGELYRLELELAVLGPLQRLQVATEDELIAVIEPLIDGVVLEADGRRATFLPKVWEQLPQPREFLRHLRHKAGLPDRGWPADMRVSRYCTENFSASVRELRESAACT